MAEDLIAAAFVPVIGGAFVGALTASFMRPIRPFFPLPCAVTASVVDVRRRPRDASACTVFDTRVHGGRLFQVRLVSTEL
jgi:hypothetical protein